MINTEALHTNYSKKLKEINNNYEVEEGRLRGHHQKSFLTPGSYMFFRNIIGRFPRSIYIYMNWVGGERG